MFNIKNLFTFSAVIEIFVYKNLGLDLDMYL